MNRSNLLRLAPLLVMMVLSLALAGGLLTPKASKEQPSPVVGKFLPEFTIPLLGAPEKVFLPALWRNEVAVINVFATWCEPCKQEHSLLLQLGKTPGVNLYGIAWKDTQSNSTAYLQQFGNPFRAAGVDGLGAVTLLLGITGLPETYVVDKTTKIRWKYAGPLTQEVISGQLLPLVAALNKEAPAAGNLLPPAVIRQMPGAATPTNVPPLPAASGPALAPPQLPPPADAAPASADAP